MGKGESAERPVVLDEEEKSESDERFRDVQMVVQQQKDPIVRVNDAPMQVYQEAPKKKLEHVETAWDYIDQDNMKRLKQLYPDAYGVQV